jgi:hypothetical protein
MFCAANRAVKNEQKFWGPAEITLDDDAIHKQSICIVLKAVVVLFSLTWKSA